MYLRILLVVVLSGGCLFSIGQQDEAKNGLLSGPMLSGVTDESAGIWIQLSPEINKAGIQYWEVNDQTTSDTLDIPILNELGKEYNPVLIEIRGLKPNSKYGYKVYYNSYFTKNSFKFKTLKTRDQDNFDEFSFVIGSGHSAVDSNNVHEVFDAILSKNPDFMLWAGSTIDYEKYQLESPEEFHKIYTEHRQSQKLQTLLHTIPNYAVWDDEEFGKKRGNKNYPLKTVSADIFNAYWPNSTGFEKGPGTSCYMKWNDCDFFLMDNRSFRSPEEEPAYIGDNKERPNPNKRYLGVDQMSWLAEKLIKSKATYKFIVGGGEWVNMFENGKESFRRDYPIEFDELYHSLRDSKVRGVVFLSGGRNFTQFLNHTENTEDEMESFYLLTDLSCGPLTSEVDYTIWDSNEKKNPQKLGGSIITKNSFVKIDITGKTAATRNANVMVFDQKGFVRYKISIPIYKLWHEYKGH